MKKILPADTLTPILAYMRVQGDHKVILESIPREKENARFSIVAYNPVFEVTYQDGILYENGKVLEQDPFDYLHQVTVKGLTSDLPFAGGAIGFAGYDMIGVYEEIGRIPQDTIGTPDMHFFIYESYLIFDHKKEKVYVVEEMPKRTYDSSLFQVNENGFLTYDSDKYTSKIGIDVSRYQGSIDWAAVKDAGVEFAMLRLGYRGYGTGAIVRDSYFYQNIQGALENGIEVGVYFFSQAINEAEAVEEAQFCMDLLQDYSITYPIVFDWEPYDSSLHPRTEGLSDEMLTKCAVAFCQAVEANGYDSMVYSNLTYFYLHYDLSKLVDFPLWLAQYNKTPTFYYHFDMWQYSSTGKVPGIEGNVDLNIQMIPKT